MSGPSPIRVLLVDDSAVVLASLERLLADTPEIQVVGKARNGQEALDLIPRVKPDVVCTDLHMPVMDGFTLTQQVMSLHPLPILVVSASVQQGEDADNIFRVIEAGAVDVFAKPLGADDRRQLRQALIAKIRVLAGVKVIRRHTRQAPANTQAAPLPRGTSTKTRLVAIGSSTGGPQALHTILSSLPASFAAPILCVQHISAGFADGMVDWLGNHCGLHVQTARHGETPRPGTVYFPREGTHLEIDCNGALASSLGPSLDGHRPSITVTFTSVAEYFRRGATGVLLTGMGRDGADGMKAIADAGGVTIAQDEESSVVFGMPAEAIKLGAAKYVLPLEEIAGTLIGLV